MLKQIDKINKENKVYIAAALRIIINNAIDLCGDDTKFAMVKHYLQQALQNLLTR